MTADTPNLEAITSDTALERWPVGSVERAIVLAARAELAALRAATRWVPVTERLPEYGQSVALLNVDRWENSPRHDNTGGRNIYDCGYLDGEWNWRPFWSIRGQRAQQLTAYTHWQPLPPAPGKEEA